MTRIFTCQQLDAHDCRRGDDDCHRYMWNDVFMEHHTKCSLPRQSCHGKYDLLI
jgi:hypothetical protein